MGKIRCPLRPDSMTLDRGHPEILTPPQHPPACCTQQTLTIPPGHRGQDPPETRLPLRGPPPLLYPPHRRRTQPSPPSKTRPATPSPAAGAASWASPRSPSGSPALHAVRNQRILNAWNARQAENNRRAAAGLRPEQGNADGKPPSPASPPRHNQARTTAPQTAAHHTPPASPAHPAPQPPAHPIRSHTPANTKINPGHARPRMSDPNVNMVPTET